MMNFYLLRILALFSLLSLIACSDDSVEITESDDNKLTKVVLMTDWYPQPEHGGFYQALAKGYYKQAGLDVEIRSGANINDIRPLVATGQIEFALGNSDATLIGVSRGLPLVSLFPYFQHDLQCIMSHPEAGIKTLQDLDGREVMIQSSSSYLEYMNKIMGIKLQLIPMDFSLARFATNPQFIQQCFVSSEPIHLKHQGIETDIIPLFSSGFDPYRVVYTTQKLIKSKPEIVKAFSEASIKGWQDFSTNDPSPALSLIKQINPQQKMAIMKETIAAMKQYKVISGDASLGEHLGQIQRHRLEKQVEQLKQLEMINNSVKVDNSTFAFDLLPEVYTD
jgi:NitT/TauT family transport system substrate-binding protein